MKLNGKVVIVTGGASGIGRALAMRFAREGAKVAVADLSQDAAQATANLIGGLGVQCDVAQEEQIQALVDKTEAHFGPVDMFCSNAGVCFGEGDHAASASNAVWQTCWEVHVMAHVYAARAVLPGMIARGEGYLLQMASAAGLLSQIGDAAYSASKHAAVSFAQSLAISHGDQGIKVSVICPQYVATPMLGYENADASAEPVANVITPEKLADTVVAGIDREAFLILPHPQVATFVQHKASDCERWIGGMRKLRSNIMDEIGSTRLEDMHRLV